MSSIKRYDLGTCWEQPAIVPNGAGDYVTYKDYLDALRNKDATIASLQVVNESLQEIIQTLKPKVNNYDGK